jgi:pimeloyl-ACP methyl ester carboxylesterase
VTLKCPKTLEAASYRDQAGIIHVYHMLRSLVLRMPVHVIYGEIDDLLYVSPFYFFFCTHLTDNCDDSPREVKDHIANEASGGLDKLASLQRVPGSGHLIVQTHPTALARALYNSLLYSRSTESKGLLPTASLIDGVPSESEAPQPLAKL